MHVRIADGVYVVQAAEEAFYKQVRRLLECGREACVVVVVVVTICTNCIGVSRIAIGKLSWGGLE